MSDRFGEQLATKLKILRDVKNGQSINASRGDTHTLDHIDFLIAYLSLQWKVSSYFYMCSMTFDHLHPVTSRTGQSEAAAVFGRAHSSS